MTKYNLRNFKQIEIFFSAWFELTLGRSQINMFLILELNNNIL